MSVRRTVNLDLRALEWALAVLRDNRDDVERRGAMCDRWLKQYQACEIHLDELIKKAST
jgi:hypothetical protein